MIRRLLVGLSIISFLHLPLTTGCDSDENEVPTDPCKLKTPYTGDFRIYENVGDSLVETDTALRYGYVTFKAPGNYTTYSWTIGHDPRTFTEKEVTLLFTLAEGKVDITLRSTKARDACFPDDPLEMTVTKSVYIINWEYAPIIGRYAGHFASTPLAMDTVEIKYLTSYDEFGGFRLININKGCMVNPEFPESSVWTGGDRGARAFSFFANGIFYNGCKSPNVWLQLTSRDSIHAQFSYLERESPLQPPPYPKVTDQFTGIRVNQ
ncbi:hypothetical protein QQ054_22255 [Oscillatoria amoena NRMC-F 0135]|nr:hypothetical protein [Oscillatoria amoena NRMC-F 0135]